MTPEQKIVKQKARGKLNYAVKLGKIRKQPCFCGNKKTEAHHEDHSKPLNVEWLCKKHHLERDGKIRTASKGDLSTLLIMQSYDILERLKETVDVLKKNPKREFTLENIREYRLFPWAKNPRTLRKDIDWDRERENILQARIEGDNKGRRYYIEARNIIKYIKKYGEAYRLIRG